MLMNWFSCPWFAACRQKYQSLVASGALVPQPDREVPQIPQDLASAVAEGRVRVPTHIVSTICDDRGEEPGQVTKPLCCCVLPAVCCKTL